MAKIIKPKRGEVWWALLDPTVGTEVGKIRPVIIVSNDSSNLKLSRVQMVPITSNVSKVYVSETIIIVAGKASKAMGDQVRTISKELLRKRLAKLSNDDMAKVENILRLQLEL
jgi:mRNA interferase MazF